jgi:hypothetical protein
MTETASWLSLDSAASGSIAPNETALVGVDFDATGFAAGVYSTTLQVSSSDPDRPEVEVQVTLAVNEPGSYSISGCVVDGFNRPLAGVTISGGDGLSMATQASGCFVFTGLAAGGYTLTASLDGYRFSPAYRSATLPESAIQQDFTGVLFRSRAYLPVTAKEFTAP